MAYVVLSPLVSLIYKIYHDGWSCLRKRVVAARIAEGQSMGLAAARFRILRKAVQNTRGRYRVCRYLETQAAHWWREATFSPEALLRPKLDAERHPDATLEEIRGRSGTGASLVAFHKRIGQHGRQRRTGESVYENRPDWT